MTFRRGVLVDEDLAILDGMHRLSIATYLGREIIPVTIYKRKSNRTIQREFLWEKGFSKQQIALVMDTFQEVMEKVHYNYFGIIWPSAMHVAEDILEDLNSIEPDNVRVVSCKDLEMTLDEFKRFFKQIYRYDHFVGNAVDNKIDLILHSAQYVPGDTLRFGVFELEVNRPEIALNQNTGMPRSNTITRYKLALRKRYKNQIHDYAYDTIMHIADNFVTSKALEMISSMDVDLSDFFERLNQSGIRYVALKLEGANQCPAFPHKFFLNSDIDLLIEKKHLEVVTNMVIEYIREKYDVRYYDFHCGHNEKKGNHLAVRLLNHMVLLFDIMTTVDGLSDEFAREALDSARFNSQRGLFVCSDKMETLCRLATFIYSPHKRWHLDWIRQHIDLLNENDVRHFLQPAMYRRAKMILRDKALGDYSKWQRIEEPANWKEVRASKTIPQQVADFSQNK